MRAYPIIVALALMALFALLMTRLTSGPTTWGQEHVPPTSELHGRCGGTVRDFHNMLELPAEFVANKIAFRSCVSHTSETVVADISGPGCIRVFWVVTGMGNRKKRPKHCVFTQDALMMVLRVYFDGSSTPSIEAPLGALFGIHHTSEDDWGNTQAGYGADNVLFKVSENGAMSLIAPMPFSNGCRITLQDENPDQTVKMRIWAQVSYYQYRSDCSMPETMRLRALYRRQDRQHDYSSIEGHLYKRSYHVGHAQGSGYLLGFTMGLTVKDTRDQWFHNGAEMIIVDHTTNPRVMKGTGGEDFFGTSCWFDKHHNFADWGFMYGDNDNNFSAYRFFVSDFQIPFRSEFTFDYGANRDVIETVMFWYQRGMMDEKQAIQKLPPLAQRVDQPVDSTLFRKPPTGIVPLWRFTDTFEPKLWDRTRSTPPEHGKPYMLEIEPVFGFVSIGEYFFEYRTNEGYPVNLAVYGEGSFESDVDTIATLVITHDDPFELFLNGELVYRGVANTFSFHSHHIKVSVRRGSNKFHCTCSNYENVNTRAWVFGLMMTYDPSPEHAYSYYLPPLGTNTYIDGACA